MAKWVRQSIQDAALDAIALATEMYFVNGQPATRAAAIAADAHAAAVPLTSGDFAKSGASDRVLTVAAKSVAATVNTTVDHVALCDGTNLLYVATCPAVVVTPGGTINGAAFTITAPALV
jgi:hypothetical protein